MSKSTIAIFGAGKIGDAIVALLFESKKYNVYVFDNNPEAIAGFLEYWPKKFHDEGLTFIAESIDLNDSATCVAHLKNSTACISALPFFCNITLAEYCSTAGTHYFDLTEDVETTKAIKRIAANNSSGTVFMPQCGLAPGFISIAAYSLVSEFDSIDSVHMRVGALPLFPSNRFKYNLNWSTEGLINEYANPCELLADGELKLVEPLEGEERFSLDGIEYEAFNTSGGLGTLCETLQGTVKNLNYKSIRYPGHLEIIRFLMHDLQFKYHQKELKTVLERSIPTTKQDKCITFVEVTGQKNNRLTQKTFVKTVYSHTVGSKEISAIQLTTASGILAPIDITLGDKNLSGGFKTVESISLANFLSNQFGKYYQ